MSVVALIKNNELPTIAEIVGMEPLSETGLSSWWYKVGQDDVSHIKYREVNYGDRGVGWYDIYKDGVAYASLAAVSVEHVLYGDTP